MKKDESKRISPFIKMSNQEYFRSEKLLRFGNKTNFEINFRESAKMVNFARINFRELVFLSNFFKISNTVKSRL